MSDETVDPLAELRRSVGEVMAASGRCTGEGNIHTRANCPGVERAVMRAVAQARVDVLRELTAKYTEAYEVNVHTGTKWRVRQSDALRDAEALLALLGEA